MKDSSDSSVRTRRSNVPWRWLEFGDNFGLMLGLVVLLASMTEFPNWSAGDDVAIAALGALAAAYGVWLWVWRGMRVKGAATVLVAALALASGLL